jgi:hypothetical protein
MYPEKTSTGYKLVKRWGIELFSSTGNAGTDDGSPYGAYFSSSGLLYVADNTKIWEISNTGTATNRGTYVHGIVKSISFADDGTNLIIATGSTGYTLTMGIGTISAIVDANYPTNCASVTFIDGYFVAAVPSTGQFRLSALLDPSDWTPLTFATAEGMGDNLVSVVAHDQNLYLFGARSIELWYNTGSDSFPFERINGATIDTGIGPPVVAKRKESLFFMPPGFLASAGGEVSSSIYQIVGGQLNRISTPYIESVIISSAPTILNVYHENGHDFLSVYTPGSNLSYVYDIDQGIWFETQTENNQFLFDSPKFALNANSYLGNYPVCLDDYGRVYKIKPTISTDAGTAISCSRIFGPIGNGSDELFHSKIRFVFEAAFDSTPSTTFAGISIDWTDDNGYSYSTAITPSVTITTTTTGQLITAEARRLGMSAKRFYRMTCTGAARFIFQGCYLDAQQGPE